MSIIYEWSIDPTQCKRNSTTGYFTEIAFTVKAMFGGKEQASHLGFIGSTEPESLPSDFIAFDTSAKTPNEATMITWVKNTLANEGITEIERILSLQVDTTDPSGQETGVAF